MMQLRSWGWLTTLLVLVCGETSGQSFTFVAADTILSRPLGSTIEFNVTITNTSTATLTLALVRTLNNLPQGWESSMCLGSCFPPTTDSILTTPEFGSSPLNPGESRPFSVDVFTAISHGTGRVRIVARNTRNASDQRVLTFTAIAVPTGVESSVARPSSLALSQNYPNPFNPSTTIGYQLTAVSYVRLIVYDLLGREVATLLDEMKQPGAYTVQFDGSKLSSGVYIYRLSSGGIGTTKRMILMR